MIHWLKLAFMFLKMYADIIQFFFLFLLIFFKYVWPTRIQCTKGINVAAYYHCWLTISLLGNKNAKGSPWDWFMTLTELYLATQEQHTTGWRSHYIVNFSRKCISSSVNVWMVYSWYNLCEDMKVLNSFLITHPWYIMINLSIFM